MALDDAWSWWWERSSSSSSSQREHYTIAIAFALVSILCCTWVMKILNKVSLPPGPKGLPLVGNLPFISSDLHRCFDKLAQTYGPIFKLQLGSRVCVVVSSPALAKEVLKDHDTIFANHDVPAVGFTGTYGGVDMVWSPYGAHWRMLRKLSVKEMLNNARLGALYGLRQREVRLMVSQLYSKIGSPVDIGEHMLLSMFNVITSMLWGGTLKGDEKSHVTSELRCVLDKVVGLLGEVNISDLFPAVARFDLQGKQRRMKKLLLWFDRLFDSVIEQRLNMEILNEEEKDNNKEGEDFLQVMLQLLDQEDPKMPFSMTHLKALFLDMMVAGTKSTSTAIEWAMSELMKQPDIMRKAQKELEEVVGMNNMVEESHSPKLHYLDAIVKEVLRLHPTAPLLVPRFPSLSCTVGGYTIPKGTKIFVNAWAIHRDPKVWDNPVEFKPERFLGSNNELDYSGNDFRYIPFGAGRRICVGIPMAEKMLPYLLGSLLHSFQWKLPEGTDLDLSEKFGLELKKETPLIIIPQPRVYDPQLYT